MNDRVIEVLDQGGLGSCVSQGVAQAIRIAQVGEGDSSPPLLSRLLVYYLARGYEGTQQEDVGCYVRDAFRAVAHFGFAPERAWPYRDDGMLFRRQPPWEAFREAIDQRSEGGPIAYERILSTDAERLDDIRRAIAAGHAVVFGTDVSEDFCAGVLAPVAEQPPIGQQIAGGHCMCIVGYEPGRFRVVNSWGEGFGEVGRVWFAPEYLAWAATDDLWIVSTPPLFAGGTS